jgi:hypothetical protein
VVDGVELGAGLVVAGSGDNGCVVDNTTLGGVPVVAPATPPPDELPPGRPLIQISNKMTMITTATAPSGASTQPSGRGAR